MVDLRRIVAQEDPAVCGAQRRSPFSLPQLEPCTALPLRGFFDAEHRLETDGQLFLREHAIREAVCLGWDPIFAETLTYLSLASPD